jgi:nucleoid DNA-binding protein
MKDGSILNNVLDLLTEQASWSRHYSREYLRQYAEILAGELARDGQIRVRSLGFFHLRRVQGHISRHEQTGEALLIPAHCTVQFIRENSPRDWLIRLYQGLSRGFIFETVAETAVVAASLPFSAPQRYFSTRKWRLSPLWVLIIAGAVPLFWCFLVSF